MTNRAIATQEEGEQATVPSLPSDFRDTFTSELDFVCRSLERLGVRAADVHDVAQELFLAVYQAFDTWDRSRPVRPWLFGYAVRFASNYRRLGWHKGRPLDSDEPVPSPRLNDKLEAKRTVLRALGALTFEQRIVLVMHDLEEFTGAEVAAALGVPLFTVYSRVRAAREAFRAEVAAQQRGGES